jgi:hypothetical protein
MDATFFSHALPTRFYEHNVFNILEAWKLRIQHPRTCLGGQLRNNIRMGSMGARLWDPFYSEYRSGYHQLPDFYHLNVVALEAAFPINLIDECAQGSMGHL